MSQREQQTTRRQTVFPFIGGALALDLVNTDILVRGAQHDFFSSLEEVKHWWQQVNLHYPTRARMKGEAATTQWDIALLTEIKALRGALRAIFLSLIERRPIPAHELEELNRVLALGYRGLEVNQQGEAVPVYEVRETGNGTILLPIALSALRLITESERDRLHKCNNTRCVGLFYDMTRSATRHWCSPECMNRARSQQHYQQVKATKVVFATKQ